jgi:hypothetical protein
MLVLCLCVVLSSSAFATWTYVKSVDCSAQADSSLSQLRTICSDSSGNLYFNCYFGTPVNIYKVANPLDVTPTISIFCTPTGGLGSTYTSVISDASGNIYTGKDGNTYDANSWIEKYDSSGNLVTSFGTSGRVAPIVAGATEANRRPWHLSWTGPTTNLIMMTCQKGAPEQVACINASTGANADTTIPRTSLNTYCDENNNGSIADEITAVNTGKYLGHCYDESTGTIYGNGGRKLVKVTSSTTADLTNLSTFDTYSVVSGSQAYVHQNEEYIAYERDEGLIAYTKNNAAPFQIAVWDIAAATEELINDPTSGHASYGTAFFTGPDNGLYLAVAICNGSDDIYIFQQDGTAVKDWSLY